MKTLCFVLILISSIFGQQEFEIKQITNLPGKNCRSFSAPLVWNYNSYFVFEAHSGNTSNIYLGKYYPNVDSFSIILNVSDDDLMNINPGLFYSYDTLCIYYESISSTGSDIVFKKYNNNILSGPFTISDGIEGHNPKLIVNMYPSYITTFLSFESNGSIFIKEFPSESPPIEVLTGNPDIQYFQASMYGSVNRINLAVKVRSASYSDAALLVKTSNDYGHTWDEGSYIIPFGLGSDCNNIRYLFFEWVPFLTWDDSTENFRLAFKIPVGGSEIDTVLIPGEYDIFDFYSNQSFIITEKENSKADPPRIYSYKALKNDSLFIRTNVQVTPWFEPDDSLIFTRINNSSLALPNLGMSPIGDVFYIVWEDSLNDNIQLFGRRNIDPVGGVNDPIPGDYIIFQNYPNPFNPTTIIKFSVPIKQGYQNIQIKVFDILGRERGVLVNEFKVADEYEIEFNGAAFNLATGIYFCTLSSGYRVLKTLKMLYLK